jgi:hypothetical protein
MGRAARWLAVGACVLLALLAGGLFVSSLTSALQETQRHQTRLVLAQRRANAGLDRLEPKLARLVSIEHQTRAMLGSLAKTDRNLVAISSDVDRMNRRLTHVAGGLRGVSTRVRTLDGRVGSIAGRLGGITHQLGTTSGEVAQLAADVRSTAAAVGTFPAALSATNSRLGYINLVVGSFGSKGVVNHIDMTVKLNGTLLGTAVVDTIVVPKGAWRPW